MNSLEMLLAKPIFQALGWALVHFIWQGAIVAILYAGVAVMLRKRAANVRYSVACAAMLLMLALPIATIFIIGQSSKDEFISKNEALISTSRASETESESLARITPSRRRYHRPVVTAPAAGSPSRTARPGAPAAAHRIIPAVAG